MDNSIRPTIEKIKMQEQDNEQKLREKREVTSALLSLNRSIHNTSMNLDELTKEYDTLIRVTEQLQQELFIENIRQCALSEQVTVCRAELNEIQKNAIRGISSLWENRTKLFESVQNVADKCDIWALLIKPKLEIKSNVTHKQKTEEPVQNVQLNLENQLKAVIDRRNKAIALRNNLLTEPDVGEEFIRTRNALQYSMEIMSNEY